MKKKHSSTRTIELIKQDFISIKNPINKKNKKTKKMKPIFKIKSIIYDI